MSSKHQQDTTQSARATFLRLTIAQWLSIVFALIIVATAVLTSSTYKSSNTDVETENTQATTSETGADEYLTALKDALGMSGITYDGHLTPYTVDGYAFETGLGATTRSTQKLIKSDEATTYLKSLRAYMDQNGYEEITVSTSSDNSIVFDSVFTNETVVCEAVNTKDTDSIEALISCVDLADLQAYAKAQSVFFDAYAANSNASTLTIVGYPTVEKSKVFGYETAMITVGDPYSGTSATAYFYQSPDDTSWQYFTTTDKVIPCSAFTSDVVRYAFTGETCYDSKTDGELTVSIDLK